MADIVDKATRSRMMAGIKGKDTKPEVALRRALHAKGLRFRVHAPELPGRPDIVLPRRRAIILVHGCFWHRHEGCRYNYMPRSNIEFWKAKFSRTQSRDLKNLADLFDRGWRVAIVWECALQPSRIADTCEEIVRWVPSPDAEVVIQ